MTRDDDLILRRMRDAPDEYERLVNWLNQPHVREWWDPDDPPSDVQGVVDEYRSLATGASPTTACIMESKGMPIGYAQFYPWAADPEALNAMGITLPDDTWGLDIFIGDAGSIERGLGSRAVAALCRYLFKERGAAGVALTVAKKNLRAQRAYEKAGLYRVREVLDTDTKGGERVPSFLMTRTADRSEKS